jgi:hypothetical protein
LSNCHASPTDVISNSAAEFFSIDNGFLCAYPNWKIQHGGTPNCRRGPEKRQGKQWN